MTVTIADDAVAPMKFSIRDLLWLTVVVALLAVVVGLVVCWRMQYWTSEYTHQMFIRFKDGEMIRKDREIKQLKEMLKKQAPPQMLPGD